MTHHHHESTTIRRSTSGATRKPIVSETLQQNLQQLLEREEGKAFKHSSDRRGHASRDGFHPPKRHGSNSTKGSRGGSSLDESSKNNHVRTKISFKNMLSKMVPSSSSQQSKQATVMEEGVQELSLENPIAASGTAAPMKDVSELSHDMSGQALRSGFHPPKRHGSGSTKGSRGGSSSHDESSKSNHVQSKSSFQTLLSKMVPSSSLQQSKQATVVEEQVQELSLEDATIAASASAPMMKDVSELSHDMSGQDFLFGNASSSSLMNHQHPPYPYKSRGVGASSSERPKQPSKKTRSLPKKTRTWSPSSESRPHIRFAPKNPHQQQPHPPKKHSTSGTQDKDKTAVAAAAAAAAGIIRRSHNNTTSTSNRPSSQSLSPQRTEQNKMPDIIPWDAT
jgi:hypothetical protein